MTSPGGLTFGSLARLTATYFGVNLVLKALALIPWIYLGRILPPEEIAVFTLVYFLVEIVRSFVIFGTHASVYGEVVSKGEETCIASILLVTIAFAATLPIVWFSAPLLEAFSPQYKILRSDFFSFGCMVYLGAVFQFISSYLPAVKKPFPYFWLNAIQTLSYVLAVFGLATMVKDYRILIWGRNLSLLVSIVYFIIWFSWGFSWRINFKALKKRCEELVPISASFSFKTLIGMLSFYYSRLFLERYVGTRELGIFSYYFFLIANLSTAFHWFNSAYLPLAVRTLRESPSRAFQILLRLSKFSLVLGLFAISFGLIAGDLGLFQLILKPPYSDWTSLFRIMILTLPFEGIITVVSVVYYNSEKARKFSVLTAIVFLFTVGFNSWLISVDGLWGAAVARFYVITAMFLLYVVCDQDLKRAFQRVLPVMIGLIVFCGLLISGLTSGLIRDWHFDVILACLGACLALLFKSDLVYAHQFLKGKLKR